MSGEAVPTPQYAAEQGGEIFKRLMAEVPDAKPIIAALKNCSAEDRELIVNTFNRFSLRLHAEKMDATQGVNSQKYAQQEIFRSPAAVGVFVALAMSVLNYVGLSAADAEVKQEDVAVILGFLQGGAAGGIMRHFNQSGVNAAKGRLDAAQEKIKKLSHIIQEINKVQ